MDLALTLAAAPVVQMRADNSSWFGNVGSAFLALVFLGVTYVLAKNNKGPWGPRLDKRLSHWDWDWKSLMSAVFGFLGVTALLGSTGILGNFARWMQELFTWLGGFEVVQNVGMAGICVIIGIKIWMQKNDNLNDIRWGGIAALAFPLGGGIWTQTSLAAGNFLVGLLHGVPSS